MAYNLFKNTVTNKNVSLCGMQHICIHCLSTSLSFFETDAFRISLGSLFHKVAAEYLKEFRPYLVDLTRGIFAILSHQKEYLDSFIATRSCK